MGTEDCPAAWRTYRDWKSKPKCQSTPFVGVEIFVGGNSHPEWTAPEQHLLRDGPEQLNPALQNNGYTFHDAILLLNMNLTTLYVLICWQLNRDGKRSQLTLQSPNWVISILCLHLQTNHKLKSLQPTLDLLSIAQHWTTEFNTGHAYWCQHPHFMTAIGLETLPYCHLAKVNEINFGIIFTKNTVFFSIKPHTSYCSSLRKVLFLVQWKLRFTTISINTLLLFSHPVVSMHVLQHTRPPCPSPSPRVAQVHVDCISDAVQPSHPLMPSSSALHLSPHQGLFQWVICLHHQVTKILALQLQHQSFQWIFRVDLP